MVNFTAPGTVLGLLDTGTSAFIAPKGLVNAYYSQVAGSQAVGSGGWQLPCSAVPPTLTLVIGGQSIPMHPLDLNGLDTLRTANGSLISICSGGIVGNDLDLSNGVDIILGDTFLKNVYTM